MLSSLTRYLFWQDQQEFADAVPASGEDVQAAGHLVKSKESQEFGTAPATWPSWLQVYKTMVNCHVEPSITTFGTLISAASNANDYAVVKEASLGCITACAALLHGKPCNLLQP